MSASEAQVIARALFDSLTGAALQALHTATSINGEVTTERLLAALPADAPREVRNLILALGKEGNLDRLPAVVAAFEQMTRRGGARPLTGEVTSAVELSPQQRERITEQLKARYGPDLEVRFSVDESLIGGLIIRIGDQVLDTSLRTRMAAIQRNMMTG
ncbi:MULTISPECIES: ATP synthase F1 subunit delta [Roseiflexus]|uniref:ATP synthase subunit delta n=1 Tax=Roseiflexus castenholzii (strain DSM 13941 / HLO8) TaxID=383372 RepID=ATPD_ROSCS|nr:MULTISPECIES: ATP synthase F1 subunit delta [Roseiflexus]A7NIR2.1 RecName: Full=ATP synthase subunit delta; AltName: Full=ATP synthase F(1) sector subunit delta; AltName: Full=F-type ATPase subunit delta; Short=F-ATPase subunit delta [Roseiflexus castenholzii DSM 13941]ABU57365.1 H+transporting two-sector ATPase delta (OSCP) subunit [Roseiflexus castenholzii DSM 13941]GIW00223.1 MAG: ATP synthase subunit delta [Roseiflexus sp.]